RRWRALRPAARHLHRGAQTEYQFLRESGCKRRLLPCFSDHGQSRIGHPPMASISPHCSLAQYIGKKQGHLPNKELRCLLAGQDREPDFVPFELSSEQRKGQPKQLRQTIVAWTMNRFSAFVRRASATVSSLARHRRRLVRTECKSCRPTLACRSEVR